MAFINERFKILDFQEIRKSIESGNFIGKGGVLLTFDDGYRDNYEHAFPILQKYEIKGLFFILSKYIGQNNLWNKRAEIVLEHLTQEEVQALIDHEHSIGSHGLTHHRLTKFNH